MNDPYASYTAGDFLNLNVTVLDTAGDPVDISAAQDIRWGLFRSSIGGEPRGEPLLNKALGNGISITNGEAGQFRVRIDNGDTDGMAGNFYHEVEIVDAEGRISTVFRGQFPVLPQGLL